jgi:drug/metabolite transporter (DMT)-like permease
MSAQTLTDRFRERILMAANKRQSMGIMAALSSAAFLGLAPVFGRLAILSGFSPLAVVALRTGMAAVMMFVLTAIFKRQFLYIFPVGLAGCFLAGAINGLGSILYYLALGQLPASLGQLIFALYPLFVAVFSVLDKQPISRLTLIRVGIAAVAVFLLTNANGTNAPLPAVLMMIGAAALYALHIPINQRVLYEIPAPTVTTYTLLAMSSVTLPFYLIFDRHLPSPETAWWPVVLLTLVTFASRLTLFLGIKNIGGLQAAILGLSELFITILLSHYLLHESLTAYQWIGATVLGISIILVSLEKHDPTKRHPKGGWLAWIHPPEIQPWSLQD